MGNRHPNRFARWRDLSGFSGGLQPIRIETVGLTEVEVITKLTSKCTKYGHPIPKYDNDEERFYCGTRFGKLNPVFFTNRGSKTVAYVYFSDL